MGFYSVDKQPVTSWKVQNQFELKCTPVIYKESLYVGGETVNLFSLEAGTGKLRWRYQTARGTCPVAVREDTIYSVWGRICLCVSEGGRPLALAYQDRSRVQASRQSSAITRGSSTTLFTCSHTTVARLAGSDSCQPHIGSAVTAEDGALFTPLASDVGVVLNFRDGKQVNSLPTGDGTIGGIPIIIADTYS